MDSSCRAQRALHNATVPRTMPGFTIDSEHTNDIHYLRYRNIELETELRLIKEQLSQAQNGTQYLVNCVANLRTYAQHSSANEQGIQLRSTPGNLDHLRPQLNMTQHEDHYTFGTPVLEDTRPSPMRSLGPLNQSASTSDGADFASPATHRENDLLIFGAHEDLPAINDSHPQIQSHEIKHSSHPPFTRSAFNLSAASHTPYRILGSTDTKPSESGLGISTFGLHGVDKPDGIDVKRHHGIENGGNPSQIRAPAPSRPKSRFSGLWTSIHAPPTPEPELVLERAFLDGEHNRLMNSACFVEEMTSEEREEHWIMLGRESGRHSAKDWKLYYERVVLPAYRAKAKIVETAGAIHGQHTEAPITERTPSNTPAQTSSTLRHKQSLNDIAPDTKRQSASIVEDKEAAVPEVVQTRNSTPEQNLGVSQPSLRAVKMEDADRKSLPSLEPLEVIKFKDEAPNTTSQGSPVAVSSIKELGEATPNIGTPISAFGERKARIFTQKSASSFSGSTPSTGPQVTSVFSRPPQFPILPKEVLRVMFTPNVNDSSHFRTVLISNVASGITLAQVVSGIRGGTIVKATFLETKDMKTGPPMSTNSAMVEFLSASDAATALKNGVLHTSIIPATENVRLEARLLRTPSRPLHPELEFDMRERGLTRVLYVVCEEELLTTETVMQEILRRNSELKRPLVAGHLDSGVRFFEFADVRDAAMAWEVVEFDRGRLRSIKKGFLPDPCAAWSSNQEGEIDCTSGSDADDEGECGSTVVNAPAASFDGPA